MPIDREDIVFLFVVGGTLTVALGILGLTIFSFAWTFKYMGPFFGLALMIFYGVVSIGIGLYIGVMIYGKCRDWNR